MSGPPRINDTVHNQLDMEWSNSLGEKKKPWKTMLSFVIILAVILLAILVPARLGNPTHIPARRRPALPAGMSRPVLSVEQP